MHTREEYIYVSGLIRGTVTFFYISVPNSELHNKICQSRNISTQEIFRAAFLYRLPVRAVYKHIQEHMQPTIRACTFLTMGGNNNMSARSETATCFSSLTPERVLLLVSL